MKVSFQVTSVRLNNMGNGFRVMLENPMKGLGVRVGQLKKTAAVKLCKEYAKEVHPGQFMVEEGKAKTVSCEV